MGPEAANGANRIFYRFDVAANESLVCRTSSAVCAVAGHALRCINFTALKRSAAAGRQRAFFGGDEIEFAELRWRDCFTELWRLQKGLIQE